jgi:hypothetical protein
VALRRTNARLSGTELEEERTLLVAVHLHTNWMAWRAVTRISVPFACSPSIVSLCAKYSVMEELRSADVPIPCFLFSHTYERFQSLSCSVVSARPFRATTNLAPEKIADGAFDSAVAQDGEWVAVVHGDNAVLR